MKKILLLICCLGALTISAQSISVMSFNIRTSNANQKDGINGWENRKVSVVKMLLSEQPDVVGMQEEMPDQEAYLRAHLSSLYDAVSVSRDPSNRKDEACAIFYNKLKYDLVRTNTFWLSETPSVPSRGWDGKYQRIVTYVQLQDKKTQQLYLIFNTHLDHKGVVAREKSLQLIADSAIAISGDSLPMMVMGDLNVLPDAPELQPMWNTMQLAQDMAPVTDTLYTFNGYKPQGGKRIDYIFYRDASPLEFRIIRDGYGVPFLSDHYPIVAILTPLSISAEAYKTVIEHNKSVRKRINRQRDWAKFNYYAAQNDSLKAAQTKIDVVFYGNSITRGWIRNHPQFFESTGYICRGISGQTTAEMLVRFRQDIIDLHPKRFVLLCGINDIAQNNGTIDLEHVMGNIISMCELAKAHKIKPILCSVLPARSFRWNPFVYDAPQQVQALNRMIRDYARQHRIHYVDYYAAMADEDGGLRPGLSNDEVHPTSAGYDIMERIILQELK